MQIDEEELFDRCFRGHASKVHAFALRRCGPDGAHDVTAETFLIAWRRRTEMPAEPLPWLYGIARWVIANERRAENRRGALASRLHAEAHTVEVGAPEGHDVLGALALLRETDREALLLCAWEGLSIKEASVAAGCSATAFAVRLHRARRRLARTLRELNAEPPRPCSARPVPEVPR